MPPADWESACYLTLRRWPDPCVKPASHHPGNPSLHQAGVGSRCKTALPGGTTAFTLLAGQ